MALQKLQQFAKKIFTMSQRKTSSSQSRNSPVAIKRSRNVIVLEEDSDSCNEESDCEYESDSSRMPSDSESDEDLDEDSTSGIPQQSYAKTYENYNSNQTKLEPDHQYIWVSGEAKYEDNLSNEILLSEKTKSDILGKSIVELFDLFFSAELKKYIIDATHANNYDLTEKDLDVFVGILVLTSINKLPSQKDYWSKDIFLRSEVVANAMSRSKFLSIKSKLKYAMPEDRDENDKVWKVRKILSIFKKNII